MKNNKTNRRNRGIMHIFVTEFTVKCHSPGYMDAYPRQNKDIGL